MLFGEQNIMGFSSPYDSMERSQSCEKAKENEKNHRDSYWSEREQYIYLTFLKEHMPMITSSSYRKNQKVFKKISNLVGTRTAIQAKSHHQKLEDKFIKIHKIIAYLEKKLKIIKKKNPQTASLVAYDPQAQLKDVSVQTDFPSQIQTFNFETKLLESYIYSEFRLDEDSYFT